MISEFSSRGFAIIPDVVSEAKLLQVAEFCESQPVTSAGSRDFIEREVIKELASQLCHHPEIEPLLPTGAVAVQCTYFEKSEQTNWLVGLHRDLSIPVRERFNAELWTGWSVKDGKLFVQPPESVLRSLVAVRVHLEDNCEENGALKVIPGSHESDCEINGPRTVCEVSRGGALVMKPLLLHASSKLSAGTRRVLHFLYGPRKLPQPARWPSTVS